MKLANEPETFPNMESTFSPMRTILIPVDFSPSSINAFHYGTTVASQFRSRVILLHVYHLDVAGAYSLPYMQEELVKRTEEKVLSKFKEISESLPPAISNNIKIEYCVSSGPTVEEIIRTSRVFHADHIIMGMRGENQSLKKILGSTSLSVINQSNKPVLLIPENVNFSSIKQIAYATNFEEEDPRIIDQLLKLAKPFSAKVFCVHVKDKNEKQDLYKEEILKKAFEGDVPIEDVDFLTLEYDDVVGGLNQFVKERNIDVLVMLTHKRSIFSRIFQKSQTKQMAIESQVPLWTFFLNAPAN